MKKNLMLAGLITAALLLSSGPLLAEEAAWTIEYPHTFEIPEGSYAWLVNPGRAEKVTTLVFDWNEDSRVLKVNGEKIFPGLPEPHKVLTEQEIEKVYGKFSIIEKWHEELGLWRGALDRYKQKIAEFQATLDETRKAVLRGEMDEKALQEHFQRAAAQYPISEIIARDEGLQLLDDGFIVFVRWPSGLLDGKVYPVKKPELTRKINCTYDEASVVVRQIVSFYKIHPHVPHVVFIDNGGPTTMVFGEADVEKIETSIAQARREKQLPQRGGLVSKRALSRILEFGGDKNE